MKITRSALKSLIKEEMNRINEEDPASRVPTTSGEDANKFALEGMTVKDVAAAFQALVRNRSDGLGLTIEGLPDLRSRYRSIQRNRREAEKSMVQVRINIGHHEPDYNSHAGGDGSYSDDTDRTAWATATVDNRVSNVIVPGLEDVVNTFNNQNGGKGGQVKQGSQDQFHFTASDNVSEHPLGGATVWL